MNYSELKQVFQELKRTSPKENLTAHIIFTKDSFTREYPLLSRTYSVSSNNNGFWTGLISRSIFAYCLDVTSDQGVRLDWYMADEGNPGGWKVEDCYILEQMQNAAAIPTFTRAMRGDGITNYFFEDTCIQVRESYEDEKIRLEPLTGDRAICGEWVKLPIDRVYGYCTLLERHFHRKAGNRK